MDFALSEEQEALRATARSFLAEHSSSERVRRAMASELGFDPETWKRIGAELGWPALIVPESNGGLGLGWIELSVLLEATGEALLCAPFFSSVCLGVNALRVAGSDAQKRELLPAIAGLTLVQAAELGRYGITANAIAPSARTRMTETVFADMMKRPEDGFDAMAPENVSPLVVWLGSAESREVTGRVFEVSGGSLSLADGWREGPKIDRGARWEAGEIGAGVRELLRKAVPPQKVYGT